MFRQKLLPTEPPIQWVLGLSFPRGWDMRLTTGLYLLPRLMSGTVPLLPLYAFMVCTGMTLPLPTGGQAEQVLDSTHQPSCLATGYNKQMYHEVDGFWS